MKRSWKYVQSMCPSAAYMQYPKNKKKIHFPSVKFGGILKLSGIIPIVHCCSFFT